MSVMLKPTIVNIGHNSKNVDHMVYLEAGFVGKCTFTRAEFYVTIDA